MAIIKCKMCGGDMVISDDKTYGTCEYCGSQMTLPKISDDQRAAAFNRGNHFRRIGEFDKALQVYERIVGEDETDAEAHWCCALCRFGIEYVEDPASFEYIPTCHRASFDNFLEDVDYLAAVEHSNGITRRQYQKDGAKIAEVQRGILATSQNEEPYDVFICYKETDENGDRTRDSAMAQDIYYQLTEQGRRVFFARITLEDKVGAEYEPYIFAALHSAKVMVVVGTSAENLNAVWVKNEWSRFLAMMKHDRNKILLPCYRNMDPYDLPEQLSVLQSYDMGKIGFIQDLTRGISKVLDADRQPEPVKETVVVQKTAAGNADALLKRGYMALEDGEWEKADQFFEEVLNQNAECSEAYLGKVLAEEKSCHLQKLAAIRLQKFENVNSEANLIPKNRKHISESAQKYMVPKYLTEDTITGLYEFDLKYQSYVKGRKRQRAQEESYWTNNRNMNHALQFADSKLSGEIQDSLSQIYGELDQYIQKAVKDEADARTLRERRYTVFLQATDLKVKELQKKAINQQTKDSEVRATEQRQAEAEKKRGYDSWCKVYADSENVEELRNAAVEFSKLGDYYESKVYAAECTEKANRIEAAEKQRQEEERKKQKKKSFIIGILVATAAVIAIVSGIIMNVVIPGREYTEAQHLLNIGEYDQAIELFEGLEDFKDSETLLLDAQNKQAEEERMAKEFTEAQKAYAAADKLEATGEIAKAAIAFGKLGNYKDSHERSMGLWRSVNSGDTICAGLADSFAVTSDGQVKVSGTNDCGEGLTDKFSNVIKVRCNNVHTLCLRADGSVLSTKVVERDNLKCAFGQDKVESWNDIIDIAAGNFHSVGLKSDGTVIAVGNAREGIIDLGSWSNIIAIDAGLMHTVGLQENGRVVAYGEEYFGQCDVSHWRDIIAISAGHFHTVGLKKDGTVVATRFNEGYWGKMKVEDCGMCDVSDWTDIVAVSAGRNNTIGLKKDGTVVVSGSNKCGQCDVSDWTDIVAVSAGAFHVMGLRSDGTVVAAGDNEWGQCDVSSWNNIKLPEKVR